MPTKNCSTVRLPSAGSACMAAAMRLGLGRGQGFEQVSALGSGIEQPLATVGFPSFLLDIAVIDELPQDARQALLGDLEDIEEIGDGHTGAQVHEVEDPVVGATKSLLFEHVVGIADEIAIGKKEQPHDIERKLRLSGRRQIYVSLVDIYFARWHAHLIAIASLPYHKADPVCQGQAGGAGLQPNNMRVR